MRVCYGLVGMTRGHAARALAIGQELLDRGHEVLFCTEGDAEELLSARFGKERVLKTSTPKYYLKNGRLSIWRTVFGNRKYLYGRRKLAKPLLAHLQEWKPDLTISDYEPLMWQASKVPQDSTCCRQQSRILYLKPTAKRTQPCSQNSGQSWWSDCATVSPHSRSSNRWENIG
jgi:uncharacterized protein (TIGR00661 family)